jgi:hypothetical protein
VHYFCFATIGVCGDPMPRRIPKKERGVFERVPDSGNWWIRYKVADVEHREKVGRRSDAIKLYAIRKADILRGMKMPANVKDKGVKNVFGKTYKIALADGRVTANPARLVEQRALSRTSSLP